MAPSDLICVYCGRSAFAVLNLEVTAGRARWPLCSHFGCIQRGLHEAGQALNRAAGQAAVGQSRPPAHVVDADSVDVTDRSLAP